MSYNTTKDELDYMAKKIKNIMKFNTKFYKNQEFGKGQSNEKRKGSSENNKIEYFNYGGLRNFATNFPSPKDIKKSTQATWSDIYSKESASSTSKYARCDPNDFLAFIASIESVDDSDSDSDNELTND